jgi:hypothetical protein
LRRLSAEAALVDSSGARDHRARCAWLRASGRRSSSRRYPRQLFCVGLVGFAVRARGTAARMNALQLESGRLGASRFFTGDYSRSLQYARLTDALLRLRPFGTRQKNSVGPDALGVPRPCFAARETSENFQMISQRRKRLAFAPAASDVRFGDCFKRTSALALERRLRCDPSHAGVMPYGPAESWLPRLSATPYPSARRLRRLDSLALCCGDVRTFSPEHGFCQIKFFRWSHLRTDAACAARKARLSRAMATCLFESPPITGLLRSAPARLPR